MLYTRRLSSRDKFYTFTKNNSEIKIICKQLFFTYCQYCTHVHAVQQPIVLIPQIEKKPNYCQL
jgi:hypothetical protein